jgi:TonB-dependent receptor
VREIPVTIKVGADVRTETRDLRGVGTETYTYVGNDGRASNTPFTQAGLPNDDSPLPFLDVPYSERIPDFGLPKTQQVNNNKLWEDYVLHPNKWTRNAVTEYTSETNASKVATETISSAFIRADLAFFNHRLKIVTGLRAEQTNIDARGPLNDPTRNFQRDSSGKAIDGNPNQAGFQPVLIAPAGSLAATQLTLTDRGTHAKKEYLRLFPSINLNYNIADNLVARAAYYQSIGRPDFNQYAGGLTVPNTEIFNPNDRITVNNVSIKAWQAKTYMTRVEYYFGSVGQLSAGYFIRDYENMFGSVVTKVSPEFLAAYGLDEETYGVYSVSTQFNVPTTIRTTGFEIDYKQALTFLPSWARGFQVSANVSSQRGKNTFDYFQDLNPFTANWGVSFSRPKFNLRINENYRGIQRRAAVTGASIEPGTYNYRPKRLYVDVGGEYFLRRSLGLFFSMRNVLGATEDVKIYGPNTPRFARFRNRDDYGGSLWTAGIKGTF